MVTYDLHKLGWHSFQQLSHTIFREIIGQTIESFLDSHDGGRDGAFTGIWQGMFQEQLGGRFVFQSKFTSKPDTKLSLSHLKEEVLKAKRLVDEGLCDCYILVTNAGISGKAKEAIEKAFKSVGVKNTLVFGYSWICEQIQENKRLRSMVPRLYGLGDLSEILDERVYEQAEALLMSLKDELGKVVVTSAYNKALNSLNEYGFVLLVGEPAAGKTTIASLLAMSALDNWGARTLKLTNAADVVKHWNPNDPSQFFWIDDAFGITQFESELTRGWNHIMPQLKTMLKQGAKIVMTSRDYIYNRARKDLKEGAFPLFMESQVVIDVRNLKVSEKQQILYNHLKLGRQPKEYITAIKPFLQNIASNSRFVPETARRLADPIFTKGLIFHSYYIAEFVEGQQRFLKELVLQLDDDCKGAFAILYMRNDNLLSPIALQDAEATVLARLNSTLGGCIMAMESMKGSLVQYTLAEGDAIWRFKHPTIGDAFAAFLIESPEHLSIYLEGNNIEKTMSQVTCGDVGMEKAVVVPKILFPLMLQKLNAFTATSDTIDQWRAGYRANDRKQYFLAFRCSKEFLQLYIADQPDILEKVSRPGLYLDSASEVALAITLHSYSLLPKEFRAKFIETVSQYAIEGQDMSALTSNRFGKIFTDSEFEDLKKRVLIELLPVLDDVRHSEQDAIAKDASAEEELVTFLESLNDLKKIFSENSSAVKLIEIQIEKTKDWIAENDEYVKPAVRKLMEEIEIIPDFKESRSVFDDIDE